MWKRFAGLVLLLISSQFCLAQSQPDVLNNVLAHLEETFDVTFSYADDVVAGLLVPSVSAAASLDEALYEIAIATGLNIEAVDEDLYIIEKRELAICALVKDADTSKGLGGVQLLINGKATSGISNHSGEVKVTAYATYQDSITFSYIGYVRKTVAVGELYNHDCPEVDLIFGSLTLEELVITNFITSGIQLSKENHSLKLKTDDLALLPGETDGDILLGIKTLPGIHSPDGKAGNLHIRGSTTDQTLLLFDDIPIYHKGHYYGAISPYNPSAVSEVNVYRSGYGADLGGRVGGAISIKTSMAIPDSGRYEIGLNSYYAMAGLHQPISKRLAVSANMRSSYPFDYQSPKLSAIEEFVYQPPPLVNVAQRPGNSYSENTLGFQDINLGADIALNNGRIGLSGIYIANDTDVEVSIPSNDSNLRSSTYLDNYGVNLSWQHSWSSRLYSRLSLVASDYRYKSDIRATQANGAQRIPDIFTSQIKDKNADISFEYLINPLNETAVTAGASVINQEVINSRFRDLPQQQIDVVTPREGTVMAAYLNYKTHLAEKLMINAGLRSNYYSLTDQFYHEPRVFINYDLTHRWSLKGSGGRYSQYITQNTFFDFEDTRSENLTWHLATKARPVVTSAQVMLGTVWYNNNTTIDLEAYYKDIDDISTSAPGVAPEVGVAGALEIYGADVLLKRSFGALDAWLNYSYLITDMHYPQFNQLRFETYYDQTHALNLAMSVPWRHWKFSAGWQLASGVPVYTDNTFFPQPGGGAVPPQNGDVVAETSAGRYEAQHQLDVAVVYQIAAARRQWSGTIGLSLLNVYDRRNLIASNYEPFGQERILVNRYSIGFAPNLMFTIRF